MIHADVLPALPSAHAAQKIFVHTFGCQMNILDSQLVLDQLTTLGYGTTSSSDEADIVLLNTCSVRALAEEKVWSMLGRLAIRKRSEPALRIGVLGCMAEREAAAIAKRAPHVDLVCGPSRLAEVPALLAQARSHGPQQAISGHTSRRTATRDAAMESSLEALDMGRHNTEPGANRRQAYVRITRGCNKFCAFCVVPFTRGAEVHRPPQSILAEVLRLVDNGVREITLLGQTINHYRYTHDGQTTTFAQLLALLHDEVPQMWRLRFLTSYPRDFTDDILAVMAKSPRMARYLHLPAQSGSDRLLKKMNRGYSVADYEDLIARARAYMPDVRFVGDMIVGYPTETDADHAMSLALLERVQLSAAYIFKYSPRSGTVAARRQPDDVPDDVKRARNNDMLALQAQITHRQHQRLLAQTVEVLVEKQGESRPWPAASQGQDAAQPQLVQLRRPRRDHVRLIGRAQGNEIVAFDGPVALIGEIARVDIAHVTPTVLFGSWVGP